uniref:Uncharacterized protein n=1 Tax=Amphora coffeiformis TaxID=265554 RepID=A0A7S3KZ72_9STRA
MGATLEDSCSNNMMSEDIIIEGASSGDVSMCENTTKLMENMKAAKKKNKKKNGKGIKKKNSSDTEQQDKYIGGPLVEGHEEDEWTPLGEMDFDQDDVDFGQDDDSYSSGFASCETTPSVYPFSTPASPRRAHPVSHYKMKMSVSTPTSSPRRGRRRASDDPAFSPIRSSALMALTPPLEKNTSNASTNDTVVVKSPLTRKKRWGFFSSAQTGMTPVTPRQRRLSLWGKATDEKPEKLIKKGSMRRHSIDGSMHGSMHSSMRQIFFGSKANTEKTSTASAVKAEKKGKKSKKSNTRRRSIDNSMHRNTVSEKPRRRLSLFGGQKNETTESVDNSEKLDNGISMSNNKTTRRHSIDNSLHSVHLATPRRRLSLFGVGRMEDTPEESPSNTNKTHRRRLSFFGAGRSEAESCPETPIDGNVQDSAVTSPPRRRRRFSFFGASAETEETTGKPSSVQKKRGGNKRRHSIDGSMHSPPPVYTVRREESFFGTKIIYDERPNTSATPPKDSKKTATTTRRHSIDGSMHCVTNSPPRNRRRLSFFGSSASVDKESGSTSVAASEISKPKHNKVKKSKKLKTRKRRHSIDGSMHR